MKSLFKVGCLTILALAVALVTLAFLFSPSRQDRVERGKGPIWRNVALLGGDVKIESGETVQGNLLVVGDDLELEGRIGGNLVVVGGDAELDSDSRVGGDLSVIGGDAEVKENAKVGGNVAVVGGDASLEENAYVGGNVNVIGGEISTDPTAYVGGSTSRESYDRRDWQLQREAREAAAQLLSQADLLEEEVQRAEEELQRQAARIEEDARRGAAQADLLQEEVQKAEKELQRQAARIEEEARRAEAEIEAHAGLASRGPSWLIILLGRLVRALLWTLLMTGLVLLVAWLLPAQVERILRTAEKETALSFAAGAITLMGSALLAGLLTLTICFALLALPLLALLALVILGGWTVTCCLLGRRLDSFLAQQTRLSWNPLVSVALCSLVLTGVTMFSWAIFVCLGFFVAVLIGSTGAGAVVVHFARSSGRFSNGSPLGKWNDGNGPPEEPAEPGEPPPAPVVEEGEQPAGSPQESPGPGLPDDFSRLEGIGPTYAQRLREAGVTSFAQLAETDAERLAAALGWSTSRVERSRLRERASELAAGT